MSAKRELFKSPDVCEMTQLQPYVLRSWEAEFPGLGQPAPSGQGRIYRRTDIELVLRIKQLVFGEGLTLAGARRQLEEDRGGVEDTPEVTFDDEFAAVARVRLKQVRDGLQSILQMLSRQVERVPELQLVAPSPGSATSGLESGSGRAVPAGRADAKASGAKRRRVS